MDHGVFGSIEMQGTRNVRQFPDNMRAKTLFTDDSDVGFAGFGESRISGPDFTRHGVAPLANSLASSGDTLQSGFSSGRQHTQPKDVFWDMVDKTPLEQHQHKLFSIPESPLSQLDNARTIMGTTMNNQESDRCPPLTPAIDNFRSLLEIQLQQVHGNRNNGYPAAAEVSHELTPEDIEMGLRILKEGNPLNKAKRHSQGVRDKHFGNLKDRRNYKLSRLPPKSGKDRKKLSNQDSAAARRESERIYCDILCDQMAIMEPIIAKLEKNYETLHEPVKCVHRFEYRICPFCAIPSHMPEPKRPTDAMDDLLGTDTSANSLAPGSA